MEAKFSSNADVLIVGGGPSGLSLALALAQKSKFCVSLVERNGETTEKFGEVLSPAIIEPLSQLGIWERFTAEDHQASAGVSIWWGSGQRYDWDYIRLAYGCGWHVNRARFDHLLFEAAQEAGVVIHQKVKVKDVIQLSDDSWLIHGISNEGHSMTWTTRFLVHAAGRTNLFHKFTGPRIRFDRLVGLARYYSRSAESIASEARLWVEATPYGWWYSATLPDDRCVAVFLTDSDYLTAPKHACFDYFLTQGSVTRERLAGYVPLPLVQAAPADSSRSTRYTGPAFLTIGDAAFSTDPLRGHGILNALRHATTSADVIINYLNGSYSDLKLFDQQLEADFSRYLSGLTEHYNTELRWRDSKFWSRRHRTTEGNSGYREHLSQ